MKASFRTQAHYDLIEVRTGEHVGAVTLEVTGSDSDPDDMNAYIFLTDEDIAKLQELLVEAQDVVLCCESGRRWTAYGGVSKTTNDRDGLSSPHDGLRGYEEDDDLHECESRRPLCPSFY